MPFYSIDGKLLCSFILFYLDYDDCATNLCANGGTCLVGYIGFFVYSQPIKRS